MSEMWILNWGGGGGGRELFLVALGGAVVNHPRSCCKENASGC